VSRFIVTALVLAALAAMPAGAGLSGASFSDQTQNPSNTFTAAASFCSGPGSQTVAASADTYVAQGSPTQNFGTASDLFVQSKSGVPAQNRRTLVRFNLPSIPAGCKVTSSELRLFATAAVSGRTIDAYRANGAWAETGVRWDNQPATIGSPAGTSSGTGWRTWSVTQQVLDMYGTVNNGFVVRDSSEDSGEGPEQKYQAREGTPDSQDPQLVVTWG
jgi:hypothetical protein